ncbi:MAG: hypothetical protein WB799_04230 [Candidatus Sulfotelmatobacter sp.]
METGGFGAWGNRIRPAEVGLDLLHEGNGYRRLRVRPSGGRDGTATIMAAVANVADDKPSGF